MFRKQLKIKSNVTLKNSERKIVREKLHKQYPLLTEDDLNHLMPKKETLSSVKVVTATEATIQVYTIQKKAICFELNGKVFPTLHLLWQFPNVVPSLTTNKNVAAFITSGADLMMPGVLTPPAHSDLPKYGNIQKEDIVAINLCTNKAPFAVGTAAMSSYEMENSGGKGKCVSLIHFHGDTLSTLEGRSNIPEMGPPEWLMLKAYEDDFPALGKHVSVDQEQPNDSNIVKEPQELDIPQKIDIDSPNQEMTSEEVDELLHYCFFTAIKYSKSINLPILTSNFYKLHMLAACPPTKALDIKKSSFKKLKPFLDKMCQDNVIKIEEMKKGVESIVTINKTHPKFEAFYVKPADRPRAKNQDDSNNDKTQIIESYIITQSVLPIFNCGEYTLKKGDTVLGTAVRKHIREYVLKNQCQHENPGLVQLNPTLSTICKNTNAITWEELYEKVCNSMKNCFKVNTGREEIINKGKVAPITLNVATRTGNKKVTMVDNLSVYGINIGEFAKDCQHGVAASTSISTPPGSKTEQLLVQGNQVLFVHNLLVDKYKIPKKYIRGLELAKKKTK